MLKRNPPPELPLEVIPVINALRILSGDRINIHSRISYMSLVTYMDREIPQPLQSVFQDLFFYADDCWIQKVHEVQNRERKEAKK